MINRIFTNTSQQSVFKSHLDKVQKMDHDELQELQLRRLQWSVQHAYENVDMYRKKFDVAGVHPKDVQKLSDLQYLPFTTKDDLRESYPFGSFAVPRSQIARIHASSGTTGHPTVVGYTAQDLDVWATLVARAFYLVGAKPGDFVQNSFGYGLFTGGLGIHAGLEKLGCAVIPMSAGQTDKQIQVLQEFFPRGICCTPTYLLTILDTMRSKGINPRDTSLQYAVVGAEPWTTQMRDEIEQGFGITVSDIYGLSELIGPGVAAESATYRNGATIWEDHFIPEIISPENPNQVLLDGEEGELVLTSLTKEAMPIIRYRTKDLSALYPGDIYPAHRRMQRIYGRTDDMIILRGVNVFPSYIEELILGVPQLSPYFQLHITRPARMDCLAVHVEHRPRCSPQEVNSAGDQLRKDIKNRIGINVDVIVKAPGTLQRSDGKARRIHDFRIPQL